MSGAKMTVLAALSSFLKDLKNERRSVFTLYKRNFFHRYAGAKFNLLWVYLIPCSPIIIYNLLEKLGVFGSHDSGIPRSVYVTFGLTLYFIFPESLNIIGNALSSNRNYILKTGLSKISAVLASFLEITSNFVIRMALMIMIALLLNDGFSPLFLMLPMFGFIMMLISFPCGIFIGIFSILYKDLNAITGMIGFYLLFASGIFMPIEEEGVFFSILRASPIYKVIEAGREVCLFDSGMPSTGFVYICIGGLLFFFISVIALYRVDPLIDQSF